MMLITIISSMSVKPNFLDLEREFRLRRFSAEAPREAGREEALSLHLLLTSRKTFVTMLDLTMSYMECHPNPFGLKNCVRQKCQFAICSALSLHPPWLLTTGY